MENIKVLIFCSDWYNLEELQKMTDFERYNLASTAKSTGSDDTEVLTLAEFQKLFNDGDIFTIDTYFSFIWRLELWQRWDIISEAKKKPEMKQ